jgi:hypothetical protein
MALMVIVLVIVGHASQKDPTSSAFFNLLVESSGIASKVGEFMAFRFNRNFPTVSRFVYDILLAVKESLGNSQISFWSAVHTVCIQMYR